MFSFAAFTKIVFAVCISLAALITNNIHALLLFFGLELLAAVVSGKFNQIGKAVLLLVLFAVFLFAVQMIAGSSYTVALVSALRMLNMAVSILLMLITTKTQQITAALVTQCRLPYQYAFMVTAVFRFVPDLLEESKAVREAQACRGYKNTGSPLKRIIGYMAIIKPMVFRAIMRSENMAVSLEMRGFSESKQRTFMAETKLQLIDYIAILVFIGLCSSILQFV